MLWIVLSVVAGIVLLAFLASLLRFRVAQTDVAQAPSPVDSQPRAPGPPRPSAADGKATATVEEISAQRQFIVRSSDGQEHRFSSLDEMPEEMRAAIEQADRRTVKTRVVVVRDGQRQEYESLEAVPEDVRERFRAIRNGERKTGIVIEVGGKKQYFESREQVPESLRKLLP